MRITLPGVSLNGGTPDGEPVNPAPTRLYGLRLMRRARHALAREHGFTIVETLMAGVILLVLATGIAGVLTSSIAANTVARERTVAQQCANNQIEQIRRKTYDTVGLVSGNPPGTVSPTAACGNGLAATATITIQYVDDPTPTSYSTAANYKKVTVTVTRDRDGKQLARFSTFVAPEGRAPYGGINNAIINATVIDLGLNQPYVGATVALSNGPSPNRNDTTDTSGTVSFAALTPNPTTGAQAYYDLTVTAAAGYVTLPANLPPGTATPPANAAHIQLAPAQTSNTSIQIYKPATINLVLVDAGGSPYTGGAALRITSSFTGATTTVSVAAGSSSKTFNALGGNDIIPGATYTVEGRTTTGLCAMPAASPVPASGYPGNTTGTFTLQFTPCPSGDIAVNVKQLGVNIAGATVTVTGGPNNMSFSGTTNASGNVTFTVPEGTGYTVTATKGGQSANTTAAVTVGATTNVNLVLPNPPTGTLNVNVTQLSAGVSGATVTLSGGPWSIAPVTGTTNASGLVTFTAVPAGSGYTITATKGSDTATITQTVSTGTTTANVALPEPADRLGAGDRDLAQRRRVRRDRDADGRPVLGQRQRHLERVRHRHLHERAVRHRLHGHGDEERADHDGDVGERLHRPHDQRAARDADGHAHRDRHLGRAAVRARHRDRHRWSRTAGRTRARPTRAGVATITVPTTTSTYPTPSP